ncbi:MAG: arylsulfatase [Thermoguttaceae bacterium]
MKRSTICLFVFGIVFVVGTTLAATPPNIVFILADDLGYGDLGCYGQTKIKTPAIDSLAAAGMRFTRHYAGCAVCAPSRAVLMTGMHMGHCVVRDNREVQPEGQEPFPEGTVTLAERLHQRGYVCGLFGKWGLGAPDSSSAPLKAGFDRFYGYNCQRVAHSFYPASLWDNDQVVVINTPAIPGHSKLPAGANPLDEVSYHPFIGENYSADLIAAAARQFVTDNRTRPFFLYWATTVPHLALQVPEDSLAEYEKSFDDEPYRGDRGYLPHRAPRAAYAAMITRLDREVGRLVELLRQYNLIDNTLIVFTSDNGPLYDRLGGTDSEFFNSHGGLRGRKGSLYEGGIRVPCVAMWNGKIASGATSDRVSGFEDWAPTLLELASSNGSEVPPFDGISLVPTLRGESQSPREFLYREFPGYGGQQAIWAGDWKAIRTGMTKAKRDGKTPADVGFELYNLREDGDEKHNVAAEHPDIVTKLNAIADREHAPNPRFPLPLVDE